MSNNITEMRNLLENILVPPTQETAVITETVTTVVDLPVATEFTNALNLIKEQCTTEDEYIKLLESAIKEAVAVKDAQQTIVAIAKIHNDAPVAAP